MAVAIKSLILHLVVQLLFLRFTDTAPDIYENDAELYGCLHASDIWCDY
jgi:hypothetical protein